MEVASGVGDGVFWVGLATYLIEAGAGPVGFALAAIARFGPRAVISAPAGALADRVDRRRLLVGLDLGRAVLLLVLAFIASIDAPYEVLLVVVLAVYSLASPYRPALTAALPLVVGEDHLARANALVGTTRQTMTFVGPVVGTGVLVIGSPTVAFVLDAASFAVAALLISRVAGLGGPETAADDGAATRSADTGPAWHAVWRTAGIVVVTVLVFAMYVARGAEIVLLVFLAEDRLGMGPSGVGVLTGAIGLGAIVALPVATRMAESDRPALMTVLAVASSAVPLVGLAVVRSPVSACAVLVVVGAGIVVFETLSVVFLQRLADRQVLGRVFGVVGTASNAGKLVGALTAPLIVAAWDVSGALVVTGVALAVVGAASIPSLRALTHTIDEHRRQVRPLVDRLEALTLFEGASRATLERIATTMVPESVPPQGVVIREGDPADDLFIVRSGAFVVTEGRHVVNRLGPSDWFGEIGLLQHRPRTATVTAAESSEVWRVPGPVFLAELASGADAPAALLDTMADRLATSERIRREAGS